MGMLVDGVWCADVDRFMVDGRFEREVSALPAEVSDSVIARLADRPEDFVLVASNSCPWSHGAVLAWMLKGFSKVLPLQLAGGPRVEGYVMGAFGPLSQGRARPVHALYTATVADFTGRSTVPVLWDAVEARVVSNDSAAIMRAFDVAGVGDVLAPEGISDEIDGLIAWIFEGLSNGVYRAGLAERQDAYDAAIESVFGTLDALEQRLAGQVFLFGDGLTLADLRLFATLVRFDTVYATHFRCTRKRLVDYPNLWGFTRELYQIDGVAETVRMDHIVRHYHYSHDMINPNRIIPINPVLDFDAPHGRG